MDTSHLVKILNTGWWSVTYNAAFVKQNVKKRLPLRQRGPVLPGRLLSDGTLRGHLIKLSELPGWHFREDYVVHVCRGLLGHQNLASSLHSIPFDQALEDLTRWSNPK